jgi:hypothetical protein
MPTTLAWNESVDVEPGRKASVELAEQTVASARVGAAHAGEESALLSKHDYSYSDALPGNVRCPHSTGG